MRAWAHPGRLQILSLLTSGEALSAADVGRSLNLPHATASYHSRQLRQAGLIEVGLSSAPRRRRPD
jgi:DNA-binding transcriptional ArsR family regulator